MTATDDHANEIPRLADNMEYAGLLPFMALAIGMWLMPASYSQQIQHAIISYEALILAFMGAVYWGMAMLHLEGESKWQLGFSVLPALPGWGARTECLKSVLFVKSVQIPGIPIGPGRSGMPAQEVRVRQIICRHIIRSVKNILLPPGKKYLAFICRA